MMQIKAPQFPESIADGEVAAWHAAVGDAARRDQLLVEIETDKVVLEVVAPADGKLTAIHKQVGDTVLSEEPLADFAPGEASANPRDVPNGYAIGASSPGSAIGTAHHSPPAGALANKQPSASAANTTPPAGALASKQPSASASNTTPPAEGEYGSGAATDSGGATTEARTPSLVERSAGALGPPTANVPLANSPSAGGVVEVLASPAAKKLAEENRVDLSQIAGTGKDNRIMKEDVLKAVAAAEGQPVAQPAPAGAPSQAVGAFQGGSPSQAPGPEARIERRVPMTRLRASIARRLVEAQQTAAMLTTFNEIDMQAIIDLRNRYKQAFAEAHNGTRLGFMSFFIRASVEALKRFPAVNASIDGSDIVYHGYQDIGVAVSSPRGLVVPVIRDADSLTLAELEEQVRDYGVKARDGKLGIDEMTGGTFTISNGGVFGSLLSTPILNPPQTGILGMHKIQERPVVVGGEIVARPMMYVALSYDHRLIDGQEAVRFLVTIKDFLEEPARILLDI